MEIDQDKLMDFLHRFVGDLGATMARAYPGSAFTGSDYHEESIISARKRIADAGLGDQVRFDVAAAAAPMIW